jgi:hypothetical protein
MQAYRGQVCTDDNQIREMIRQSSQLTIQHLLSDVTDAALIIKDFSLCHVIRQLSRTQTMDTQLINGCLFPSRYSTVLSASN